MDDYKPLAWGFKRFKNGLVCAIEHSYSVND